MVVSIEVGVIRPLLNESETATTSYVRNTSPGDLQKVFANKIKYVQAYIDARGHHFQRLS
jgi:hypothetical protein